jgi:hypothetical protein
VFVVEGGSYVEYQNLLELSKKLNKKVILDLISEQRFLLSILEGCLRILKHFLCKGISQPIQRDLMVLLVFVVVLLISASACNERKFNKEEQAFVVPAQENSFILFVSCSFC